MTEEYAHVNDEHMMMDGCLLADKPTMVVGSALPLDTVFRPMQLMDRAPEVHYVCGLMFNQQRDRVVLIRKTKPAFMAGKLNGVGGKIEVGETPPQAMEREFHEEAGLDPSEQGAWNMFMSLHTYNGDVSPRCRVDFFRCFVDLHTILSIKGSTSEGRVDWFWLRELHQQGTEIMNNLRWIVPMALAIDDHAAWFSVTER